MQTTSNVDRILELYPDSEFMVADGFDNAIIGFDPTNEKLVYSSEKCVEILIKDNNMSETEALEYFYFNVEGAYVGEKTPLFINELSYYE